MFIIICYFKHICVVLCLVEAWNFGNLTKKFRCVRGAEGIISTRKRETNRRTN